MAYGDFEAQSVMRYGANILVVATEGGADVWAAYARPMPTTAQEVRSNGEKISYEEAARLFPEWAERLSWRR